MDDYINAVQQQIAQNNAWSAEQAQKQMEFQERMSNTAHQREVEDLKAAGLNPVLSARLGGASTPSGAMADTDNSGTSALAQILTKVLDVQNENAKALQSVASGNSGNVISSDNSAKGLTSTDVSGALGVVGVRVPNSAADVVASFINGATGKDNGNNKASTAYKAGETVASAFNNKGIGSIAKTQAKLLDENKDSALHRAYNTVSQAIKTAASSLGIKTALPSVHSKSSSSSVIKKGSTR